MQTIQNLFAKYTTLTPPESSKKKHVIVLIREESGVVLSEKDVRIQNATITLCCHPVERVEVLRCKHAILTRLREECSIYISRMQ